jgi:hypothetical protein
LTLVRSRDTLTNVGRCGGEGSLLANEQPVERERRITSNVKATVTGRRHVNRIVRRLGSD